MRNDITLKGLGKVEIEPIGYFHTDIKIDTHSVKAKIYVIEDHSNELIIGMDVINLFESPSFYKQLKRDNQRIAHVNYLRINYIADIQTQNKNIHQTNWSRAKGETSEAHFETSIKSVLTVVKKIDSTFDQSDSEAKEVGAKQPDGVRKDILDGKGSLQSGYKKRIQTVDFTRAVAESKSYTGRSEERNDMAFAELHNKDRDEVEVKTKHQAYDDGTNVDGHDKPADEEADMNSDDSKHSSDENEKVANVLKIESQTIHSDYTDMSKDLEENTTLLSIKESQVLSLTESLSKKESELLKFQCEFADFKHAYTVLNGENTQKELESLQNALMQKNEENIRLNSKLQLAEQKVEMINKDSSQHVMTLQTELSKLKNENTKNKADFDQKLAELKNGEFSEKEKTLLTLKNQIEEYQVKMPTINELLENKDKELLQKESANNSLQKDIQEKESQIEKLSRRVEASDAQFKQLNEQGENSGKLLVNKEAFIKDFNAEKEKQILDIEDKYKVENFKLQGMLLKQENDIKVKELLDKKHIQMDQDRSKMREEIMDNELRIQEENRQQYKRKRKKPRTVKRKDPSRRRTVKMAECGNEPPGVERLVATPGKREGITHFERTVEKSKTYCSCVAYLT